MLQVGRFGWAEYCLELNVVLCNLCGLLIDGHEQRAQWNDQIHGRQDQHAWIYRTPTVADNQEHAKDDWQGVSIKFGP